jgi:flagellin-like hook-associated protein FlgL
MAKEKQEVSTEETIPEDEELYLDNQKANGKKSVDPYDKLRRKDNEPGGKESTKSVDDKGKSKSEDTKETVSEETPDTKKDAKQDTKEAEPNGDTSGKKAKEPDTKESKDKSEPEKYEIIHLGKKVEIPASERDKYLQMGYDYPHVKQEAAKAKKSLDRIAEIEGFKNADEYLAELDKREKEKLAEKIEEAYGDPEKIDEIIKNHPRIKQNEERERELAERERKMEREKKKDNLREEEFFNELEPELNLILDQNPNLDPSLAFSVLVGNFLRSGKLNDLKKKNNQLIKETKESTEKKVMADIHDKERRTTPKGGNSNSGKETEYQPSETAKKLSKVFGVSAKKIARRANELTRRR